MKPDVPKPFASRLAARNYAIQLAAIADCLAPFGLSLPEGTPTTARRSILIRSQTAGGPIVLMKVELDGGSDEGGLLALPPAIALLSEALVHVGGIVGIDLRVLCTPRDWDSRTPAVQATMREADLEMKLVLDPGDLEPGEPATRRLRIRLGPRPVARRFAAWLERHPFMYSLALLGEFSFKHPLFGQVLCGGPCGISGAWQFTCTMGKTFFSRRQLEQRFFDRPVFVPVRNHPKVLVRGAWQTWASALRLALRAPIGLRKAIVWVARTIPRGWFSESRGFFRAAATTFFNHLECPKSIRNGACGAPTSDGLCGELLKHGVSKMCIFYYRNARDLRGERLSVRLIRTADGLRSSRYGAPAASLMRTLAAITARRRLSMRIYPRMDTDVAGASAIVSAMRGRFHGLTVFGSYAPLPRSFARSEIALVGVTERGARLLARARRTVGARPRWVSDAPVALAAILMALTREEATHPGDGELQSGSGSTYESILSYQTGTAPGQRPPPRGRTVPEE